MEKRFDAAAFILPLMGISSHAVYMDGDQS